jgi:hypothetical protein
VQAANDNNPLGGVYSFDEAAAHLGVSKRSLQELIKVHPHYAKNGRVYLFSADHIRKIFGGMECHSDSCVAKDRLHGTSVAPSEAKLASSLRALTTKRRPKQSVSIAKLAS